MGANGGFFPLILNGIEVKVLNEIGGNITIEVNRNRVGIDTNYRMSAKNIYLPNITNWGGYDTFPDLIVKPSRTLLFNRSGSINKDTKSGNGSFSFPTTFTCKDSSIFRVDSNAWTVLVDSTTLLLDAGTRLIVEANGVVYVECGSRILYTDSNQIELRGVGLSRGKIIYQSCYSDGDTTTGNGGNGGGNNGGGNNGGGGENGGDPDPKDPEEDPLDPDVRPSSDTVHTVATLCRLDSATYSDLVLHAPDSSYLWNATWCVRVRLTDLSDTTICLEQTPWGLVGDVGCYYQERQDSIDLLVLLRDCFGLDLSSVDSFEVVLLLDNTNSGWNTSAVYIWSIVISDVSSILSDYFSVLEELEVLPSNVRLSEDRRSLLVELTDLDLHCGLDLPELPLGCEYNLEFDSLGFKFGSYPEIQDNKLSFEILSDWCYPLLLNLSYDCEGLACSEDFLLLVRNTDCDFCGDCVEMSVLSGLPQINYLYLPYYYYSDMPRVNIKNNCNTGERIRIEYNILPDDGKVQ
jgi:hypothetical protein